jgi:5-methylcytosine-specific restriction endonuclease McrA
MSNTQSFLSPDNANALAKWSRHPFYTEAVVLGLDIGLEGIGVHVRKGADILYAKTWAYDVPAPARLETRRQLRAARHCRANRKTRMHRLEQLFIKHGLPWLAADSDEMLRSDPFILRHRAIASANGLASKQALSIAIRHCVAHRGHDYHYFDEGAFPWGESTDFKKVMKALPSLFLMEMEITAALLEAENFDWKPEELTEFSALIQSRLATDREIEVHLEAHTKGDKNHLRTSAKGKAFPRTLVRAHLEKIINRHAHLIADPDGFLSALFVEPRDEESKARSIFYFHRKTPQEMRDHFTKKKAHCAYGMWLAGKDEKVGTAGDIHVRRWRVLEFAATRDLEVETKKKGLKKRWRVPLGDDLVQHILDWLGENHAATQKKQVAPLKDELIASLTAKHSANIAPSGGKNGSTLNDYFFKTLADLLALSKGKRTDNAPLSAFAAERLYTIATANGTNFSRDGINARLKDCAPLNAEKGVSLFDFRRFAAGDLYGVYPQVEFLLGQRVKKAKGRSKTEPKKRGDTAVKGKLQLLFERELAPILGPNAKPDYCIAEVIRDIPRNTDQRKEREDAIKENTERRAATFKKYGLSDDGDRDTWRKLKLYASQDGFSPYTGAQLPKPGTDGYKNDLQVEHLYPAALGGLTVTENLVVTFEKENTAKGKGTPREYAAKLGKPFADMLAITEKMRWGKDGKNEQGQWFSKKREIFAWEDSSVIPDLGNTTRVAQLAKQLQSALGHWLGCKTAEEIAQRIGSPSGFQTSICRMAWNLPKKDRTDLTHHLVDAAILAHIPPREGQNYVASGGIFYPDTDPKNPKRQILRALPLGPDAAAIATLSQHDGEACPLIKHRSTSNHRRMHDKTLLGVFDSEKKGALIRQLRYRQELDRTKFKKDEIALEKRLIEMGIPEKLRPSRDTLARWLEDKDGPPNITLRDGSQLGVTYTDSDEFHTPFGFVCRIEAHGEWQGIKVHTEKFDALELWKTSKGYTRQRRPNARVMQDLFRTAFRWVRWTRTQPGWTLGGTSDDLRLVTNTMNDVQRDKRSWKSLVRPERAKPVLHALIRLGFDLCGKEPEVRWAEFHKAIWGDFLPPEAVQATRNVPGKGMRHVLIRKGDTFRLSFDSDEEFTLDARRARGSSWFHVSAISADNTVEFSMLLEKPMKGEDKKAARHNKDGLPYTKKIATVATLAALLGLPEIHDPPPSPSQRKHRPARDNGQADLGL